MCRQNNVLVKNLFSLNIFSLKNNYNHFTIIFILQTCNIFKRSASSALRVIFTGEASVKCPTLDHCCAQYVITVDGKPCNAVPVTRGLVAFGYKADPYYDDVTVQGTCTGFGQGAKNVEVSLQKCPCRGKHCLPLPKSVMTGSLDMSRVQIIEV